MMKINYLIKPSWNLKKDPLLKIILFITIIIIFGHSGSGYMSIMMSVLTMVFLLKDLPQKLILLTNYPIELRTINVWGLWVFLTGIFVSKDLNLFLNAFNSLIALLLTINLIYLILLYDFQLIKYIIIAVSFVAIIQLVGVQLGFQTSDIAYRAEKSGREYGLTGNPNSYGLRMVYSSIALLIMVGLHKLRFNLKWVIIVIALSLFLTGILNSASRKSAIAFFLLIVAFVTSRQLNRNKYINLLKALLFIITIGAFLYLLVPYLIEGSVLEERFLMGEEKGGVRGDIRFKMYKFAVDLFMDNPYFGVGLNNYRFYFPTGQYSHSDYAESLSSTGLFGFVLYQLFYIIPFVKGYKMSKQIIDRNVRLYLLLSLFIIIIFKFIGTGIILYTSPPAMIFIVCIIAYFQKVKESSELFTF